MGIYGKKHPTEQTRNDYRKIPFTDFNRVEFSDGVEMVSKMPLFIQKRTVFQGFLKMG